MRIYYQNRWTGLNLSEVIQVINVELESAERRKQTLENLLNSGKVSPVTYDLLNKKFMMIDGRMKDLKETLQQEEDFWKSNHDEQLKILERTLISLELRYVSGEISSEERERIRTILIQGRNSIATTASLSPQVSLRPDPPNLISNEKPEKTRIDVTENKISEESPVETTFEVSNPSEEIKGKRLESPKKNHVKAKKQEKTKKQLVKNRKEPENGSMHCKNPWNGDCRNTDIELNIYYKGELLPICRECWQEISEKNLEWSNA